MITTTGLDRLKVALSPGRKAHLWADGVLCGAELGASTEYAPFMAWYEVSPRMQCQRCSLLWEKAKALMKEVAHG